MTLAPIVLFVYNRPWHTRQTIEALKKNELSSESELFIFSDGSKNDNDIDKVKQIRDYIKTIDGFKKINIIEREKNLGLANNIIDGVTRIVNKYGTIIVLEDDLVSSPYFLRYMNEALDAYKNEEKVFGITGYAYPHGNKTLPSTFFVKAEGCWSWATWARAWVHFEKDTEKLIRTFSKKMIRDFNFDNSMDFWSQVIANREGKINTWAIYWYATVFLHDGLYLYPRDSFVQNIGFDGSGEHCGPTASFDVTFSSKYDIQFETVIEESVMARQTHIDYFNSLKVPLWKRVVNKIYFVVKRVRLFRSSP